jgi:hypothetical protein
VKTPSLCKLLLCTTLVVSAATMAHGATHPSAHDSSSERKKYLKHQKELSAKFKRQQKKSAAEIKQKHNVSH